MDEWNLKTENFVSHVKEMDNDELIKNFLDCYFLVKIEACFSAHDLQMKHLCLTEINERDLMSTVENILKGIKCKK